MPQIDAESPMQNSVTNCGYLMMIKHSQQLELKRNYEYYYQIMGQMGLTGCAWCDLFVYATRHSQQLELKRNHE